jgi:hypothetical protein
MKKHIKLPFTCELKGGNKKSFKILNEEQLAKNAKKDVTILNVIKKFITFNNNNNNNNNNNLTKVNYIKGSDTKEYYKKIRLKK